MSAFKDIVGERFGRLVVVGPYKRKGGMTYWLCACDCGSNPKYISLSALRSGNTKSCECFHRETAALNAKKSCTTHGKCGSKIYACWSAMIERCNNPKNPQYRYYGARGIKVIKSWLKFENFYRDMGDPPPGMTLERVDNNGNYYKKNCTWVSMVQQCNNRRNSIYIEYLGEIKTLSEWSRDPRVIANGLNYNTLRMRYHCGEREKALFAPRHPRKPYKEE